MTMLHELTEPALTPEEIFRRETGKRLDALADTLTEPAPSDDPAIGEALRIAEAFIEHAAECPTRAELRSLVGDVVADLDRLTQQACGSLAARCEALRAELASELDGGSEAMRAVVLTLLAGKDSDCRQKAFEDAITRRDEMTFRVFLTWPPAIYCGIRPERLAQGIRSWFGPDADEYIDALNQQRELIAWFGRTRSAIMSVSGTRNV